MLFVLLFMILSILPLTNSTVTSLICPSTQQCYNESHLILSCETEAVVLAWRIDQQSLEIIYSYHDPVGSTDTFGNFQTSLDQRQPAKSTMKVTPTTSMHGLKIDCIDGIDADKSYCILEVIKYPGQPVNLTITHISDNTITLQWTPPIQTGGPNITVHYIVHISSENDTNYSCPDNQCNVTLNKTTITGLQTGIQYNITVSAVNCIGTGPPSSSIQLIPGKAPILTSQPSFKTHLMNSPTSTFIFTPSSQHYNTTPIYSNPSYVSVTVSRVIQERPPSVIYDEIGSALKETQEEQGGGTSITVEENTAYSYISIH